VSTEPLAGVAPLISDSESDCLRPPPGLSLRVLLSQLLPPNVFVVCSATAPSPQISLKAFTERTRCFDFGFPDHGREWLCRSAPYSKPAAMPSSRRGLLWLLLCCAFLASGGAVEDTDSRRGLSEAADRRRLAGRRKTFNSQQTLESSGDLKQHGHERATLKAVACSAEPPSFCGLRYIRATPNDLYKIRIKTRYTELLLPGKGTLKRGSKRIQTSSSLKGIIFAGAVLRLGDHLPLLIAEAADDHGLTLADPYQGPRDLKDVDMHAINLQLTPGLYDASLGSTGVNPSSNPHIDPALTVPLGVAQQASVGIKQPGAPSTVPPLGSLTAGDHITFAGVIGGVIEKLALVSGSEPQPGTAAFDLEAAYPYRNTTKQRVFKFLHSRPDAQFPGVSDDFARGRRHKPVEKKPKQKEEADEVDALVSQLSGEADALFPASEVEAANAAALNSLYSVTLPGMVIVTQGKDQVETTDDLRPYLLPGSVIKIGGKGPYTVDHSSSSAVLPSGFKLSMPFAYPVKDASKAEATMRLSIERITDVQVLPGGYSIHSLPSSEQQGGSVSGSALQVPFVDARNYLIPGDVIMLVTSPLKLVTVHSVDYRTQNVGTEPYSFITLAPVSSTSQHQPLVLSPGATTEGLPVYKTGLRRAGYNTRAGVKKDHAAAKDTGASGKPHYNGCLAKPKKGSPLVTITNCDPRKAFRPGDEIFVGALEESLENLASPSTAASSKGSSLPWFAGDAATTLELAEKQKKEEKAEDAALLRGNKGPTTVNKRRGRRMPLYIASLPPHSDTAGGDVVTSSAILLSRPYEGDSADDDGDPFAALVPIYRSGAQWVPGIASLTQGQAIVTVSKDSTDSSAAAAGTDLRSLLTSGDLLQLGSLLPVFVAGSGGRRADVDKAVQSNAASGLLQGDPNGLMLRVYDPEEGHYSGVNDKDTLKQEVDAGWSYTAISKNSFYLHEPFALLSAAGLRIRKLPYRLVEGRISVAPPTNAVTTVFTSTDLRQLVAGGSALRFGVASTMPSALSAVVSGGKEQAPTASKATLSRAINAKTLLPSKDDKDVLYATACPWLPVFSPLSWGIASDAAKDHLKRLNERCLSTLPKAGDDASKQRIWFSAYLDTFGGCCGEGGDGGEVSTAALEEVAYKQLPGTVAVIQGSPIITTTADLTGYMAIGDRVAIGAGFTNSASSGSSNNKEDAHGVFTLASAPSYTSFRITIPHPGPTGSGLPLSLQYRRVKLSTDLSVTFNSPVAQTHGKDLRGELEAGDSIEIASVTKDGVRVVREFVVVPPLTATYITLSEAYQGDTSDAEAAYRLVGGSGPGILLPGTVSVRQGSDLVRSTEDLSGSIRQGDRLRLATMEVQAMEPITPEGFTLTRPYAGTSATGLRAYNLGRTSQQVTLEQLGRLKLQCRSIYCLAKIEEMERALPSDITRSLNAAALLPPSSSSAATSAAESRAEFLRKQAEAEAAVEKEWRSWYEKAKQQLGMTDIVSGGAASPGSSTSSLQLKPEDAAAVAQAAKLAMAAQGGRDALANAVANNKFPPPS
jgi:hypothetical protein